MKSTPDEDLVDLLFTSVSWTDAYGFGDGVRHLPAHHLAHDSLSTERRQTDILMDDLRSHWID